MKKRWKKNSRLFANQVIAPSKPDGGPLAFGFQSLTLRGVRLCV